MCSSQSILPQVLLTTLDAVDFVAEAEVVVDGVLNEIYNDTIFEEGLNCRNGKIKIMNNTYINQLTFQYINLGVLDSSNAILTVTPNSEPLPTLSFDPTTINMTFNCPP